MLACENSTIPNLNQNTLRRKLSLFSPASWGVEVRRWGRQKKMRCQILTLDLQIQRPQIHVWVCAHVWVGGGGVPRCDIDNLEEFY